MNATSISSSDEDILTTELYETQKCTVAFQFLGENNWKTVLKLQYNFYRVAVISCLW